MGNLVTLGGGMIFRPTPRPAEDEPKAGEIIKLPKPKPAPKKKPKKG